MIIARSLERGQQGDVLFRALNGAPSRTVLGVSGAVWIRVGWVQLPGLRRCSHLVGCERIATFQTMRPCTADSNQELRAPQGARLACQVDTEGSIPSVRSNRTGQGRKIVAGHFWWKLRGLPSCGFAARGDAVPHKPPITRHLVSD